MSSPTSSLTLLLLLLLWLLFQSPCRAHTSSVSTVTQAIQHRDTHTLHHPYPNPHTRCFVHSFAFSEIEMHVGSYNNTISNGMKSMAALWWLWLFGFMDLLVLLFHFYSCSIYVQIFVYTSTFTTHIILIFPSERRENFWWVELISAVCLPVHTVQCLKLTENCTAFTKFISKNILNSSTNFIRNALQWRHLEKIFAEKSR